MEHYIHVHTKANRAFRRRQRHLQPTQHRRPPTPPPAPKPIQPREIPTLFTDPHQELLALTEAQADRDASLLEVWVVPFADARRWQAQLVEWFQKWRKPIRSWLRNRASIPPAEIDDLSQEVFERLLKYSNQTLVDNPQGYLFRIAANVANEWREKARVRHPHDDAWLDDIVMDHERQPEQIISRRSDNAQIAKAMGRLTLRKRMILEEHVVGELTYKQIAKKHGLTYRIVLRDLTRTYSELRMGLPRDLLR